MLVIARLLTLLAVLMVAAQPVMACCHAGQTVPHIEISPDTLSSCHGSGLTSETTSDDGTHTIPDTPDCPGCADCSSPVMQTQVFDSSVVLSFSAPEIPVALLSVHFPGYAHPPVILKTGPPDTRPAEYATLVELKQRLLI